jgi:hypothetical protein
MHAASHRLSTATTADDVSGTQTVNVVVGDNGAGVQEDDPADEGSRPMGAE